MTMSESSMTCAVRPITWVDVPWLVAMNRAAVPAVSPASADELTALIGLSEVAVVIANGDRPEEIAGFVLAMAPGSAYESENYRWFDARGTDFLYVDRIVVGAEFRGRRLGEALYAHVFECARALGRSEVTCEVNLEPPNPGSLRFHGRLGFAEVGRQSTKNGTVFVSLLAASVAQ